MSSDLLKPDRMCQVDELAGCAKDCTCQMSEIAKSRVCPYEFVEYMQIITTTEYWEENI